MPRHSGKPFQVLAKSRPGVADIFGARLHGKDRQKSVMSQFEIRLILSFQPDCHAGLKR
jgi:hypothetical protein